MPIQAIEQNKGLVWATHHNEAIALFHVFRSAHRSFPIVTLELLRWIDSVLSGHRLLHAFWNVLEQSNMNKQALTAWAELHAGDIVSTTDYAMSLTSKLLRFDWNDGRCVAVAAEVDGKVRINAVLDALAVVLGPSGSGRGTAHVILGIGDRGKNDESIREHLGAIGTLVSALPPSHDVHVWALATDGDPVEVITEPARFTTATPAKWATMLQTASTTSVEGLATVASEALGDRPAFALYPKLSSLKAATPWQMRLDGLEIGRIGATSATLQLASKDLTKHGEPRATWLKVVGPHPLHFTADTLDELVSFVDRLIAGWTVSSSTAVLQHGQAEHALEAHLLSGRLEIETDTHRLRLAIPVRHGILAAAQFPTLWGDVTEPARYLDALLADDLGRPWAIELKDQDAGGGHGVYLRHGIGQAVLYRHYIRTAAELDPWFQHHGLLRTECQAALAFPTAAASTTQTITRLRALAALFNIDVIEFERPR